MKIYILEAWDGTEWVHEGSFSTEKSAVEYAEKEVFLEPDDYFVFQSELRD